MIDSTHIPLHRSDPTDPYIRFLLDNRDKRFYRKPYPGNAGDTLISMGTGILLDKLGISETLDPRDADVILMPGGNPARWPSVHIAVWRQVWERFPDKDFVIGPAGFAAEEPAWREAIRANSARVTALFARDPASYRALADCGLPRNIKIALAHDPALHLRGSPWLEAHRRAATKRFVLVSLRDDHEASLFTPGLARHWPARLRRPLLKVENRYRKRRKLARARASADPGFPVLVQDATKQTLEVCVEVVREAAEVHTDRLHLMLLATMLGKPVHVYQTGYGKLEAIYQHSLKDWADVRLVSGSAARPVKGQ